MALRERFLQSVYPADPGYWELMSVNRERNISIHMHDSILSIGQHLLTDVRMSNIRLIGETENLLKLLESEFDSANIDDHKWNVRDRMVSRQTHQPLWTIHTDTETYPHPSSRYSATIIHCSSPYPGLMHFFHNSENTALASVILLPTSDKLLEELNGVVCNPIEWISNDNRTLDIQNIGRMQYFATYGMQSSDHLEDFVAFISLNPFKFPKTGGNTPIQTSFGMKGTEVPSG